MVRICTFDIEGNGLYEDCTVVWCAALIDHDTNEVFEYGPKSIGDFTSHLDKYDVAIGHNCIDYDFRVLKKLYDYEFKGKVVDTLVMSRTQRPDRSFVHGSTSGPHSVESWGIRLGEYKKVHEDWTQYSEDMLERCVQDCKVQVRIYKALLDEGRGEGWANAHRLNMQLMKYLSIQETSGWTLDVDRCQHLISYLKTCMSRIEKVVVPRLPIVIDIKELKKDGEYSWIRKPFKKNGQYSQAVERWRLLYSVDSSHSVWGPFGRVNPRPVDLGKNQEVKDILLEFGWIPEQWNTNAQGQRTSPKMSLTDPFNGIDGKLGKLISKWVVCRHRISTLSGWLEAVRPDGRVSPKVAGFAATGRLRHNVIVNIPSAESGAFFGKEMRSVWVAKEGWSMVGADSSGNQMRQLAARMGDEEFTNAVLFGNKEDGTDLHSINQRRSGAANRTKAKNFFYGFIYGAQAPKIASTIGITVKEAKELLERYLNEMPKLKQLIKDITTEWRKSASKNYNKKWNRWVYKNGYITGIDGRPIKVESEHALLCYMLQSDEAIHMSIAYCKFHREMERRGYKLGVDWNMLIFYHDEFQWECRPGLEHESGKLACECIKWAGQFLKINCVHEGEYSVGKNWAETH